FPQRAQGSGPPRDLEKGYPSMEKDSRLTLEQLIKQTFFRSGKSVNSVAKQSGVPQAVVQRFVRSQRGITLETADKLCAYFGLELRPTEAPSAIPMDETRPAA